MPKTKRHRKPYRALSLIFVFALAFSLFGSLLAEAKTLVSEKGENIFFYALNAEGKSVLLKVIPLEDMRAISHGQLLGISSGADTGVNYYISSTDNYPTTQYCEARGITIPELISYVKSVTSVVGASTLGYSGGDMLRFMATDSYGNYSRSWTYDELYGEKRYYFEGLYGGAAGWNTGWEIAGEDNSKFGIDLDTYNNKYKNSDQSYADKRTVFAGGAETTVILATDSLSGRTTSSTLIASTELGISDYIAENGGTVAGCLSENLEDTWSLRLCLPMSEADLMAAHRTAYDNFKWIYNMRLDMARAPALISKGTVAEPTYKATKSSDGKTLGITMDCQTSGAAIYYSFDGSPQIPYTGAVTVDIAGRDLDSDPVTFYMTAVREGYDDAGIKTVKYPQSGVSFKTLYTGMVGGDVTFTAATGVTSSDWKAWTGSLTAVSMKAPSGTSYSVLEKSAYSVSDGAKTVTFDASLFTKTGSYSFIFYSKGFANKNVSITMKKDAPEIKAAESYGLGEDITLSFDDDDYQNGLYVYITAPGEDVSSMISTSYLDRTVPGQVTILAGYSSLSTTKLTDPGFYTLALVNSGYSPNTQTVGITIRPGSGFTDVPASAWYFDAVCFVKEKGYFTGTSEKAFSPDNTMTRAMFVTVLGRLAGSSDNNGGAGSGFSDVPKDTWYSGFVGWAADNGIVSGVGGGRFDPDGQVTREQMALILNSYAKYSGTEAAFIDNGVWDSFSDSGSVSSWAENAMRWAVRAGIINGTDGKLNPQGAATRAQVAQIMMKFCNLKAKDVSK